MDPRTMSLVWANGAMRRLEDEMRCASMTDASVMLTGESGVGKQFAANMIHQLSQRRRAPFVAINAADVLSPAPPAGVGATVAVGGAFLQAPDDGTLLIQGHREDAGDCPVTVAGIHGSIDNRQETRAAHDGHDRSPVRAGPDRHVPRRFVLSVERDPFHHSAASGEARRTFP